MLRPLAIAFAIAGLTGCAASHAGSEPPPRIAGTWDSIATGPCVVASGNAFCMGVTFGGGPPRLVGQHVARVHGGRFHVCGVTTENVGVCSTMAGNVLPVIGSVRGIAATVVGGGWCAAPLKGGVRCGHVGWTDAPVRPEGLPDSVRFDEPLSSSASCARAESGVVWCWGRDSYGGLGRGGAHDPLAAPIAGNERYRSLAGDISMFCGVVTDGGVRCWGSARDGTLPDSTPLDLCRPIDNGSFNCARMPRPIPLPRPARQVAVSDSGACALLSDRSVVCWGNRAHWAAEPVVGLPDDIAMIAAGGFVACALRTSGALWCWEMSTSTRTAHVASP